MGRLRRVLVIAPDPVTQRRVQMALDDVDFVVAAAARVGDAERMAALEAPAALVVDLRGGQESIFFEWSTRDASVPLVVLVSDGDDGGAERALERGADDVVPVSLIEALLMRRLRSLLRSPERRGQRAPQGVLARAGRRKSDMLIGQSAEMLALAQRIDMIAKSDIGAAIFGETGTGKELVARTIHARSRRAAGPFVVANCTAMPEALFENELFGHERGAFTGADTRTLGLINEAKGGTLLLDEIGDIGGSVQAKLLRLLQFREYKMIGGAKTLQADVRILTTTHRDLKRAVEQGRFREDLYYRMTMLLIRLPPLRDRIEDVPLLVDHFVSLFNEREQRDFIGLSSAAVRLLEQHSWPGNVRELEGAVYRSLVMGGAKSLIDVEEVQLGERREPVTDLSRPFAELKAETIERFERAYLTALLRKTRGNLSRAAREARHERKSLWRLLQKYDIDPAEHRDPEE